MYALTLPANAVSSLCLAADAACPFCSYPATWWRRAYPPLPHTDDVTAVYPRNVGAQSIADWCERTVYCDYEEDLTTLDVTPRWMELDTGSVPFTILRDPVSFSQYSGGGQLAGQEASQQRSNRGGV